MTVEINTGTRTEPERDPAGKVTGMRVIDTVEVWINGVCFRTDVPDSVRGRALTLATSLALINQLDIKASLT